MSGKARNKRTMTPLESDSMREARFFIYSLLTQLYKLNNFVILLTINFVVQQHLQVSNYIVISSVYITV